MINDIKKKSNDCKKKSVVLLHVIILSWGNFVFFQYKWYSFESKSQDHKGKCKYIYLLGIPKQNNCLL